MLQEIEEEIQRYYNAASNFEYFNRAYATTGCFGVPQHGASNGNYGKFRTDEWKQEHSKLMSVVNNEPETRKKLSEIHKILQSRPDIVENKRIGQKKAWLDPNSKLQNSKVSQFKPVPVKFKDFTFISYENFKLFLKENGLLKNKNKKPNSYEDRTLFDYYVNDSIKKYSILTRIGLINTLQILNQINTYGLKFTSNRGNAFHMMELFDIDQKEEHVLTKFVKKYNNKFKDLEQELIELKRNMDSSTLKQIKEFY